LAPRFTGELLGLPDDASAEVMRSLGTRYTQMRYFHLDRTFKSFKLLGADDLPDESNDPNALGWNDKPKSEVGS